MVMQTACDLPSLPFRNLIPDHAFPYDPKAVHQKHEYRQPWTITFPNNPRAALAATQGVVEFYAAAFQTWEAANATNPSPQTILNGMIAAPREEWKALVGKLEKTRDEGRWRVRRTVREDLEAS